MDIMNNIHIYFSFLSLFFLFYFLFYPSFYSFITSPISIPFQIFICDHYDHNKNRITFLMHMYHQKPIHNPTITMLILIQHVCNVCNDCFNQLPSHQQKTFLKNVVGWWQLVGTIIGCIATMLNQYQHCYGWIIGCFLMIHVHQKRNPNFVGYDRSDHK